MDAEAWDERYRTTPLVWSATPNAFVERHLADLPPGRGVDLAAGEGRNAIWLAHRGWDVEAIEFSAVAVDKGRALAADAGVELTWTVADLLDDPPYGPVDLVLIAYLQLSADAFAQVLRTAVDRLAPGGRLFGIGHAVRNLAEGYGGPPDATVLWDADAVGLALEGAPVEVVRLEEVTREVDTDDGPRTAIDLLVEAVRPAG
jgi:SAM-dependent methyltransferase